jgi:hypothetical protein
MSEEEFHEFSMKQRVYELVLSPYYPDVLSLLSIDNGLPAAVIEETHTYTRISAASFKVSCG